MNKTIVNLPGYSVQEIGFDDFATCKIFIENNPELLMSAVWGDIKNINNFKYFFYRYLIGRHEDNYVSFIYQVIDDNSNIIGFCGFRVVDKSVFMVDNNRKEAKELDSRIDIIEACHTQTQVSIAKINKDIEYIRLSVDKLLNKNKIN